MYRGVVSCNTSLSGEYYHTMSAISNLDISKFTSCILNPMVGWFLNSFSFDCTLETEFGLQPRRFCTSNMPCLGKSYESYKCCIFMDNILNIFVGCSVLAALLNVTTRKKINVVLYFSKQIS